MSQPINGATIVDPQNEPPIDIPSTPKISGIVSPVFEGSIYRFYLHRDEYVQYSTYCSKGGMCSEITFATLESGEEVCVGDIHVNIPTPVKVGEPLRVKKLMVEITRSYAGMENAPVDETFIYELQVLPPVDTSLLPAGEHTVALKEDGTVIATGDNTKGQCSVEAWSDVRKIYVAPGSTVGIKNDGTVLSAGLFSTFGQQVIGFGSTPIDYFDGLSNVMAMVPGRVFYKEGIKWYIPHIILFENGTIRVMDWDKNFQDIFSIGSVRSTDEVLQKVMGILETVGMNIPVEGELHVYNRRNALEYIASLLEKEGIPFLLQDILHGVGLTISSITAKNSGAIILKDGTVWTPDTGKGAIPNTKLDIFSDGIVPEIPRNDSSSYSYATILNHHTSRDYVAASLTEGLRVVNYRSESSSSTMNRIAIENYRLPFEKGTKTGQFTITATRRDGTPEEVVDTFEVAMLGGTGELPVLSIRDFGTAGDGTVTEVLNTKQYRLRLSPSYTVIDYTFTTSPGLLIEENEYGEIYVRGCRSPYINGVFTQLPDAMGSFTITSTLQTDPTRSRTDTFNVKQITNEPQESLNGGDQSNAFSGYPIRITPTSIFVKQMPEGASIKVHLEDGLLGKYPGEEGATVVSIPSDRPEIDYSIGNVLVPEFTENYKYFSYSIVVTMPGASDIVYNGTVSARGATPGMYFIY